MVVTGISNSSISTKFLCILVFLRYLYIVLFNRAEKHFVAYKSTLYKYVLK